MTSPEHDVVAANVAYRLRLPTWEVHANTAAGPRRGVPVPDQPDFYPDVVAFEKYTGRLAAVGAVETAETLEAGAREWKLLQTLAPRLFIYVPEELLEAATRLCRRHGVETGALRVYYYDSRRRFVVERGWRARKRKSAARRETA